MSRLTLCAVSLALISCGDGSSTSSGAELLTERSLVANGTSAHFDQLVLVELEGVGARLHPSDSADRGSDVIPYNVRSAASRRFSLEVEGEHSVTVKVRDSAGNELANLNRDRSEAVASLPDGAVSIEISHTDAGSKTLFLQPEDDRTRITSSAIAVQDLTVRSNSGAFFRADDPIRVTFGSVTLESGSFLQVEGPGSANITMQRLVVQGSQDGHTSLRCLGHDGKAGDTGTPGDPGEDGGPGEPGKDGGAAPNVVLTTGTLEGSFSIQTRGGHGGPGGNGGPGGDGGEGSPDLPGGNGGPGGDGGDGGSGATVTVYYSQLNQGAFLSSLPESLGGDPGLGGDGGGIAGSPGEPGRPGSTGTQSRVFVSKMPSAPDLR